MSFKITYSTLSANMDEVNREFDQSLAKVRGAKRDFPITIGYTELAGEKFLLDINPSDTTEILSRFGMTSLSQLDTILESARKAQKSWGLTHFKERARLVKRAAEIIRERKSDFAAIVTLEVGKNRLESLGDVEESADLLTYYATLLEENNGYVKELAKLSPNEDTRSILKPYGVFAVIAPFNFPAALSSGMTAGALLGGNSVILKPSRETPWSGRILFEAFRDAGIPEGVFQLVQGTGGEIGDALSRDPRVDGIVFTGSRDVGLPLLQLFSNPPYAKPCFLELGGKNPCIVTKSANLEDAATGCTRSAFGLSGQKCSALSRVYVDRSIKDEFLKLLIEKADGLKIGRAEDKDTFVGPVINERAVKRFKESFDEANRNGKIIYCNEKVANLGNGHYVPTVICEVNHKNRLMHDELFIPFLCVDTFEHFNEAIDKANDVDYGLTAGIFSEDKDEVDEFFNRIEAGVCYANRKSGATTGAWPGVQSFCGWKGSGSTGKGGCGPYYVAQFMREQSQTRMK